MSKIHSGYSFVLPAFAKGILIIEKTEFLYDIVHDEISVYLRFHGHVLLVGLA